MHRRKVKLCFNPVLACYVSSQDELYQEQIIVFQEPHNGSFFSIIYSPVTCISFLTFQRKVQMLVVGRTLHQAPFFQLFNVQVTLKGFLT